MQVHEAQPDALIRYAIPIIIIAIVLFFRIRSMKKSRRLRIERLWVLPTIYALFVAAMLIGLPTSPLGWTLLGAGLAVGGLIGWQRGRLMEIHVDPETHALSQRQSPAALFLILGLVVLRMGAKFLIGNDDAAGGGLGPHALLVTDAVIGLALGLLTIQRVEMFLRAKRLLAEARTSRSAREGEE